MPVSEEETPGESKSIDSRRQVVKELVNTQTQVHSLVLKTLTIH